MEDTHWEKITIMNAMNNFSLNPCFNGRYSLSTEGDRSDADAIGLNPCFNGRYSLSQYKS